MERKPRLITIDVHNRDIVEYLINDDTRSFDEFNRITVEVLSVVAQQVITIQIALRQKVARFDFEGSNIPIIGTFGAFITMNPGYAGPSKVWQVSLSHLPAP